MGEQVDEEKHISQETLIGFTVSSLKINGWNIIMEVWFRSSPLKTNISPEKWMVGRRYLPFGAFLAYFQQRFAVKFPGCI